MFKYRLGKNYFKFLIIFLMLSGCDPTLMAFSSEEDSEVEVSVGSGAVDIDVRTSFLATFTQEVIPSTVNDESFFIALIEDEEVDESINLAINTEYCNLENSLSGTITCTSDELSCSLDLDEPLSNSTNYILCLTSDIEFREPSANGEFEGISRSFVTEAEEEVAEEEEEEVEEEVEEEEVEVEVDDTAPTLGSALSFSNIDHESMTVSWGAATDDTSAAADLEYKLVRSTVETEIDTISEANSIAVGNVEMDWTENTLTKNVDSLSYPQTYYYAVLVRDEENNMSLYQVNSQITIDEVAPTVGNNISFASVDHESMIVSWGAATDNAVVAASLEYKLVTSEDESAIDTLAEANAIEDGDSLVMDWTANDISEDVDGLDFPKTYYYAVLVRDTAGNISYYSSQEQATADAASPTIGGDLAMSTPDCGNSTASWTASTDNVTAQADLEYKVYYSAADNISTVDDAEDNGTVAQDWTANLTNITFSGLTAGEAYWINVLVRDEAGNISIYTDDTETAGSAALFIGDEGNGVFKVNLATGAYEEIIDDGNLRRNMVVDENCEIYYTPGWDSLEVYDIDGVFIDDSANTYDQGTMKMEDYGDYIILLDQSTGETIHIMNKSDLTSNDDVMAGTDSIIGVGVTDDKIFIGTHNGNGFIHIYDFDSDAGTVEAGAQATINGSDIVGGGWVTDIETLSSGNYLAVYFNHATLETYSLVGTTLTVVDTYEFGAGNPVHASQAPDGTIYVLMTDGTVATFDSDLGVIDLSAYDIEQGVGIGSIEYR